MIQERQLVRKIAHALAQVRAASSRLKLGIGDDAAVISFASRTEWALSCDTFLENVHFRLKTHPPDSVGYKALARATSDLAAMGATPRFFLLTLAFPAGAAGASAGRSFVGRGFSHDKTSAPDSGALALEVPSESWLNAFLKGMARASRELGITVIGGDTTQSRTIFISITVLGEITRGRALTRSGARPGDIIYVSGKLGRARLGLELVLRGHARNRQLRSRVQPHLYPKIQIALGSWLAQHRIATSAMDLSDGLSTDLARLCAASQVGAKIYASKVPTATIPPEAGRKLNKPKLDPLQLALHGGEDYELLFTVSPRQARKLARAPGAAA